MHLCTCVSEIRQSHGLGQTMSVWVVMTDAPVYMCDQGGWGRGGSGGGWGRIGGRTVFRTSVIRCTQKGGVRCTRYSVNGGRGGWGLINGITVFRTDVIRYTQKGGVVTKCYTEKHKCQLCYSIREDVSL